MSLADVLIYVSGVAGGFLVCWYWLVRPMAKLLGWEEGTMRPPTTREWRRRTPAGRPTEGET